MLTTAPVEVPEKSPDHELTRKPKAKVSEIETTAEES